MSKIKIGLALIIGILISGTTLVIADNLVASNITYSSPDSSWNVGYVSDAIDSLKNSQTSDNYSTTGKVVGTWTTGKPLYQMTVTGRTPSTINTWTQVANIGSTKHIIKYDGTINFDNHQQSVNLEGNVTPVLTILNCNTSIADSNGLIVMKVQTGSNNYLNVPFTLTVWYTVTTD